MKKLQFLVCLVILACHAQSVIGQNTMHPFSLLNWLKILDDDDYKLISAVDQNNFYFSVRVDAEGDILFASQDNLIVSRARPRSLTLRITDLEGNELRDLNSRKPSPIAKEIVYSDNSTVSHSAGTLYPLIDHTNDSIRVQFIETLEDNRSIELFNQVVKLPGNRGITNR